MQKAGFCFALEREGIGVSKGREKFCLFLVLGYFVFFLFRLGARKEERLGGLLSSLFVFKRELLGVWIQGG